MGLDIRAFSGLVLSDQAVIVDDEIVSRPTGECAESNFRFLRNFVFFYQTPVYDSWTEHLQCLQVYSYVNKFSFRAGSYSYYGAFRNWLEELVLEPGELYTQPGDPFYELVIFSDCEGVIGPTISQKLHRDFVMYDLLARTHPQAYQFYHVYRDFTNAFLIASVGGAVEFS